MPPISEEELSTVVAQRGDRCISIYLPTIRAGRETRQNAIRFRNLVGEVDRLLLERGCDDAERTALLAPLRRLLDDYDFWQHQDRGLAVFRTRDDLYRFSLPETCEELAVVGDRFHVTPVLTQSENMRFYVLTLSQEDVRLYVGNRYDLDEIDLADTPTSLAERAGTEVRQFPFRSPLGPIGPTSAAGHPMAHWHGGGDVDENGEIRDWLGAVDRGIGQIIDDPDTPVVLVGVEYLTVMYRDVTRLPHVMEQAIFGSPNGNSLQKLRERAWDIVRQELRWDLERRLEKAEAAAGTGLATVDDLESLLPAAEGGRVDALFIARQAHRWGRYDAEHQRIEAADGPTALGEDLLDRAAAEAWRNGGRVFVLDPGELPLGAESVLALYRY